MTPEDFSNVYTTGKSCKDTLPCPRWYIPKTTPAFLPANTEAFGHYFQDCSFYYQLTQCNKRTPIPITLR